MVQGQLRPLFEWMLFGLTGGEIDYLVIIDLEYWSGATPEEREILMFHEMCHMTIALDKDGVERFNNETGLPVWALKGHDVEEFIEVVARYGAWNPELAKMIEAASPGF